VAIKTLQYVLAVQFSISHFHRLKTTDGLHNLCQYNSAFCMLLTPLGPLKCKLRTLNEKDRRTRSALFVSIF
jgi:hypothetical protein